MLTQAHRSRVFRVLMSSNFEQARREGVNKEKHSIICNCGLLKPLFIMFKIIQNKLKKTIFFISVR